MTLSKTARIAIMTAFVIILLAPGIARAAVGAVATTNVNMRTGPSSGYQRILTVPVGAGVTIYGCTGSYSWCDASYAGQRGWIYAKYLQATGRRFGQVRRRYIPQVGVTLGLPIFGFDAYDYHRRYYRGRPWYRERYAYGRRGHRRAVR